MLKKLVNIIVLIPVGVILIVLSVANRQSVTLALNPFRPEDSVLSVSAPFFVFLFLAVVVGLILAAGIGFGFAFPADRGEFWKMILPIVTLTLGYLFGKSNSS